MRSLIRRVLAASLIVFGASAVGGATTAGGAEPLDYGPCRNACFSQKSRAYQRCRAIPPRDRDARESCFRSADAALERCLSACGK